MPDRFRQYTAPWIKKETTHAKTARAQYIVRALKKTYPRARIMLKFSTPMQLLVAVMLSAQCTDKKVNGVTSLLFKKYRTPRDFAHAKQNVFEQEIHSTGFYRTKARHIIQSAQKIEREFLGKLPHTMDGMLTLPGVARKTANIVLAHAYGVVGGIPVDTHVGRLAQRLGFSDTHNPNRIERDLMTLFPKRQRKRLSYLFIEHGRAVCTAQNPKCSACPLRDVCPSAGAKR